MGKSAKTQEEPQLESIDRILEATITCFARYGYDKASIKVIAEEAGVSRGLLHYHFASKEELIVSAVARMAERIYTEIKARVPKDGDPLSRLTAAAKHMYELLIGDKALATFMVELVGTANHNEALRERYLLHRDRQREFMREIIEDAVGDFAGKSPLPLDEMVQMLETWIVGMIMQRAFSEGDEEARAIFNSFLALMGRLLNAAAR
ncbi:MAG: TetR/AcrR family transcriptional regulator [Chrysiogenetes bacterium]|nr:TetR/AcrR family transcriptional regulator [Chrysiogenetes bacterium]